LEDCALPEDVKTDLGVSTREILLSYEEVSRTLPVMIPIETDLGHPHWALVIKAEDGIVDIANYKGHLSNQPVHKREWEKLRFYPNEPAYAVEIIDDDSVLGGLPD
jgi:hypothetical protein